MLIILKSHSFVNIVLKSTSLNQILLITKRYINLSSVNIVLEQAVSCDGCDEWTHLSCSAISTREYRSSIITGAEISHTCNRCILLAQPLFGDAEEERELKEVFFHRSLTLNFLTVSNLKVYIFYILMLGAYYLKLKNFD